MCDLMNGQIIGKSRNISIISYAIFFQYYTMIFICIRYYLPFALPYKQPFILSFLCWNSYISCQFSLTMRTIYRNFSMLLTNSDILSDYLIMLMFILLRLSSFISFDPLSRHLVSICTIFGDHSHGCLIPILITDNRFDNCRSSF